MDNNILEEQNKGNNSENNVEMFERFYEEFFYDLMNSKNSDVITAREYLSKSIDPKKTTCSTVEDFLHNLLSILFKEEKIEGYYNEYMAYTSAEKTGWFTYEQYAVSECLVTVLQNAFVSKEVLDIQQKLVRAAFSYMNNAYGTN